MTDWAADDDAVLGVAAGDGLAAMHALLGQVVLPSLGAPTDPAAMEDASWVSQPGGSLIVSSDGFSVDPLEFNGGDIGSLAFCGGANDVLASGGRLRYLTVSVFACDTLRVSVLRRVLRSLGERAAAFGVKIVAGDTKIVPGLPGGLLLSTTSLGLPLFEGCGDFALHRAREGDSIILTGPVGGHAMAVLNAREGICDTDVFCSDVSPLIDVLEPVLRESSGSVRAMRDLTRGGVMAGFWEGAMATNRTWRLDLAAVPVDRDVRAYSELLGLDPLSLTNEGVMMLVSDPAAAPEIVDRLRTGERGRLATIVGTVGASSIPRVVDAFAGTDLDYPVGVGKARLC